MPYPFPDTLDFTMNDILVFIGWNIASSIFFVCSEDILEWIGIPNNHIAKEYHYDRLINRRDYASRIAIALTTPFIVANVLRILNSILGLGPIGGYMTWMYILYVYYARYMLYNVHYSVRSYIMYSVSIFVVALVSWVPGEVMYNIQWSVIYITILCMSRIITGFITSSTSFVMIQPVQHILWDPLLSFSVSKEVIQRIMNIYNDVFTKVTHHED